ncbi:hypothetical protein MTBPR1_60138 [Candidatus Terasakiella magnetica]|uniref:Uncharacterized protein n=1 Tax=Candidatus Terasakiella magnetica TaxID=1867952 RepID=A0A1C3RK30_9PROT|nr:hypothetical protein [Candidatus Terasakiella magnetica]SCA57625.1 hypothetical protein MTBPR1_60138 [Candidatus Terasakiella magnetica]
MKGPNKTYIVQLPKDADFKEIRTQTYFKGGVLQIAHQKNSQAGYRAYKLTAPEDVLLWFKDKYEKGS